MSGTHISPMDMHNLPATPLESNGRLGQPRKRLQDDDVGAEIERDRVELFASAAS